MVGTIEKKQINDMNEDKNIMEPEEILKTKIEDYKKLEKYINVNKRDDLYKVLSLVPQ